MTERIEHFAVQCRIDGVWFSNDTVFPDREKARVYGREMVVCGAADRYRVDITSAPVSLPQEQEDDEGELPPQNDPSFPSTNSVDWAEFFDLVILCPTLFRGTDDSDLERTHASCLRDSCFDCERCA